MKTFAESRSLQLQTLDDLQQNGINEKYLFHGTKKWKKIVESDDVTFNIQYANKGMWGKGLYFATRANYSNNYAVQEGGLTKMLVARVILGKDESRAPDSTILEP